MLSKEEVEKSIATDLGREWELKDGKLVKSFQFSSFMNAIDFVNEIAKIAERLDHHPIITISGILSSESIITPLLTFLHFRNLAWSRCNNNLQDLDICGPYG
jgi:hypothetical protein